MNPQPSSYTNRFKSADREHVEQLKEVYSDVRADILARSRRLQQETNRRRKALAAKRKQEAAREEKRRQEILNRRREEQREATDRFQRLGKPREQLLDEEEILGKADYQYKHPSRPSPALEEALRTVSGRPSHFSRQNSRETPVLEDALKAVLGNQNPHVNRLVRQNSAQGRKHPIENGTQSRKDRPPSGTFRDRPVSGTKRDRPSSGKIYSQSTMGPNRIQEYAREAAARTELQSHSLRQTSNSRSLFEQQLEQQQSLLLEQQKQSLHHFNTAIQKEMDKDVKLMGTEQDEILDPEKEMSGRIARSDSLSSVDSLEISNGITRDSLVSSQSTHVVSIASSTNQHGTIDTSSAGPALTNTIHSYTSSTNVNSAWGTAPSITGFSHSDTNQVNKAKGADTSSVGGFILHRSPSNPTNVAVVSPSVIHRRNESANHQRNEKQPPVQGISGVGSFTPNNDFQNGPSITGPNSYNGKTDKSDKDSETLEAHGVIKTSSNGRANAHVYQDSVVNNAGTFILHSEAETNGHWEDCPKQPNFDYSNPYSSKASMTNVTVTSACTPVTYNQKSINSQSSYSPANYTDGSTVAQTITSSAAAATSTFIPSGFSHMAYLPHPPNTSAPSNRPALTMADMRASSLAGNVNASMKQLEQTEVPEIDDVSDDIVGEEEELPETCNGKQKILKGILKKTKQPSAVGRGMRVHSATTYTAKLRAQGRGKGANTSPAVQHPGSAGAARPSSSSSLRDSIEVARDQLSARNHVPKVKKRTIRWADMTYSDEDEEVKDEEKDLKDTTNNYIQTQQRKDPIINAQTKIQTAANTYQKSRPFSAKFSTNTPKVDASVRESRVASAGPRRTPFIRPSIRNSLAASKAHIAQTAEYTKPTMMHNNIQSKTPIVSSSTSQGGVTSYVSPNATTMKPGAEKSENATKLQDKLSSSVTAADIRKSLEGAVYDANGIRLDRTPTDEEINWLWDKVRTCLSRQSTMDGGDNPSERSGSTSAQPRQTAQLSNKYIDGTSLAPQLRTTTKMFATYNGNQNETSTFNSSYPKKKISMDTLNTYNRRSNNAIQKRTPTINGYVHSTGSPYSNGCYPSTYNVYGSNMYQHPAQSNFGPIQSPSVVNGYQQNGISDSMAEFLTAEEIAAAKSGSITDSQLQTALDQRKMAYNIPSHTQHKVVSALSLEEQKLLQSLERLNERLKVIEDQHSGNNPDSTPAVFVPRPPQNRQGFKGHSSIGRHRRYSANPAATVNRHRFRTGSARIEAKSATARYR